MSTLPPQRQGKPIGGRGPGASTQSPGRGMSPAQGAQEAERRSGLPCYHAGQRVQGLFGCVACQFQIRNRAVLPSCPQCGELIWAYLEQGPRPVPEGETAEQQRAVPAAPKVEEGVRLESPKAPVKVEEGVKLEP